MTGADLRRPRDLSPTQDLREAPYFSDTVGQHRLQRPRHTGAPPSAGDRPGHPEKSREHLREDSHASASRPYGAIFTAVTGAKNHGTK